MFRLVGGSVDEDGELFVVWLDEAFGDGTTDELTEGVPEVEDVYEDDGYLVGKRFVERVLDD